MNFSVKIFVKANTLYLDHEHLETLSKRNGTLGQKAVKPVSGNAIFISLLVVNTVLQAALIKGADQLR